MAEPKAGYPQFDCGPGLKLAAHEQLVRVQLEALNDRLHRIEAMMERLEKRLWLTVYGVVAAILAQGFQELLQITGQ
ncbi:GTA head formation protein, RCAP_rcc01685 family [Mesobacterium pallidum]|uniref:GTA head formation protein, RCAP_rcc01685 family n=1 Tax=Mesobacterium pallidum TaxID=2872037 RepID=UPI001EE364B2|nr:hypothetical protein [Mesobacterium pallidum]